MRRIDRTRLGVLALSLGMLSMAGLFVWLHLTSPFDGARLEPGQAAWTADGVIITPLEDQPGGLRKGDLVVAVDGQSLESWAQALLQPGFPRPDWRIGQTIR